MANTTLIFLIVPYYALKYPSLPSVIESAIFYISGDPLILKFNKIPYRVLIFHQQYFQHILMLMQIYAIWY